MPLSLSASEAFLQDFHGRHPGCTPRALAGEASGYERLAEIVAPVEAPWRVLDLACGDGYLLGLLRDRHGDALRLTGLDLSPGELTAARRRLPSLLVSLVQGRAQALSFVEGKFDAVLCHMALMLMERPDAVLAEVFRVLRPGGVFAAVLPSPAPRGSAYELFVSHLRAVPGLFERGPRLGDRRCHTPQGLSSLVEGSGLALERLEDFCLPIRCRLDEAWGLVGEMYTVDWLTTQEREAVERAFAADLQPLTDSAGTLSFDWGLRLLVARKPC